MEIQLSVITVFYNQAEFVDDYVKTLLFLERHYRLEVLIADNGSEDSGLTDLRSALTRLAASTSVTIVDNKKNLGFSRANNQLTQMACGVVLLFLNPDVLTKDSDLKACFQLAMNGGISSPALMSKNGLRYACSSPFYDRFLFPLVKLLYWCQSGGTRTCRVDWVQGACLFVHRQRFLLVGGFCEDYFLYTEDMELGKQFESAGWPVWLVQGESVYHPKTRIQEAQMLTIFSNLGLYFRGRHRLSFDLYQCLLFVAGRMSYSNLRLYFRLSRNL